MGALAPSYGLDLDAVGLDLFVVGSADSGDSTIA